MWQRLSSGRLKVFKSMQQWFADFRLYRRDEKCKVVKERDHLIDATRYLEMLNIGKDGVEAERVELFGDRYGYGGGGGGGWMS